ncbi:MAG: hypothetical protein GX288_05560 [Clostridiales bacterium]|nr:hypothetical protein [Clostridiales bacterium]
MRFVSIDRVKKGSYLAKPIYSNLGTILVKEHVKLSEGILNRLKELGFVGLYIEDKISEGIEIKDVIDEQLRIEAIITLENIIKDNGNFTEIQPIIENIVDSIIEKKTFYCICINCKITMIIHTPIVSMLVSCL